MLSATGQAFTTNGGATFYLLKATAGAATGSFAADGTSLGRCFL
jgi:hypothetical protein